MSSLEHTEIPLCNVCKNAYTRTLVTSLARPYEFNSSSTASLPPSYLVQIQSCLAQCTQILQHLRRAAYLIEQEQTTLEKFVFDYKTQTSAIRRLVPEILVRIFECLEEDSSAVGSSKRISLAPVIMSQVCSAWRWLAHSTPHLWARISIDPSRFRYEKRLEVYLDRSKDCHLDVTVDSTQITPVNDISLSLFEPHLHRVRVLRCPAQFIASRQYIKPHSSSVETIRTFNILETLELSKMRVSGMKLNDLSFPNLKSFSMSGDIPRALIELLPWSQINHVKMERNPEVLALLETHCCLRSLELFTSSSLTFALFGAQTGAVPTAKPIFFPSLQHLRIELSTVPSLLNDLNSLTVPNLESFALRPPERRYIGTQSFTEDSLLIIKDLVTRSGCETTLNELDFGWGGSANSKYLIPLLEITPNIKHLTLLISKPSSQDTNDGDNDNNPTALFFERLSASPVTFLPHLQTLTLPQYAVLSPYLPTILRLRWSSLSSLVLGDWTKGSRDGPRELEQTRKVMTELRRMKRDGWKVIRCQHAFPEFRKACKVCM